MTAPMLGTETVIVGRERDRDEDGKPATGPTTGIGPVAGCVVSQLRSSELVEAGRNPTDDVVRVFLPITEGIDADTVLTVRDKPYQVDGNPEPYIDPEDPELSGYDLEATHRAG